ncbi:MAG: hypothetical protein ACD_75C01868G0003 [uncultured bacterium]|nr:MAG: hypothetical protein ACD_75C01868G0003 [uncultured bacterium]
MSQELLAAMQRLPSWEDLQFLTDSIFTGNSLLGGYLAHPLFTCMMFLSFILTILVPAYRIRFRLPASGVILGIGLLLLQNQLGSRFSDDRVASRYNPLHWSVCQCRQPSSAEVFSETMTNRGK